MHILTVSVYRLQTNTLTVYPCKVHNRFLPCYAMLALCVLWTCLHPSLSPSICMSQADIVPMQLHIGITQTMPHNTTGTLILRCQRSWWNSDGVTEYRWGRLKLVIFDQCLTVCQRWCKVVTYSYYGMLIPTRVQSIEWCYFQWPWVTPNYPKPPHFITTWCYASAVYAVIVCPSIRLSHARIVPKRLNMGSHKQRHKIAQGP